MSLCSNLVRNLRLVKYNQVRAVTTGFSHVRSQSTDKPAKTGSDGEQRASISKAMEAYLERAREHQTFMKEQEEEFKLGRRHLANMMGKDPETLTQNDINEAIRYLFPSGLFKPGSRPFMRPPEEIFPKQKAAQFDATGRPHHPFFYTAFPNFYMLMHGMVDKITKLNSTTAPPPETEKDTLSFISGTKWLEKEALEEMLMEEVIRKMYEEWVQAMERILNHPHFQSELPFLREYREPLSKKSISDELYPVLLEPDGRKSVHIPRVSKKRTEGNVTVRIPGTGIIAINGENLEFLKMVQSREAVISPLQLSGWMGKVDVEAHFKGYLGKPPGESCVASALRRGIALGIASLGADPLPLKLAGYFTHDRRSRERTRPGYEGARKRWTWKRR